jgi:hypothetical protein
MVNENVLDMTAEHAEAIKEVARLEHAVPEEQRTLRSQHQTTRQMITGGVVVLELIAMVVGAPAWPVVSLVGVLGGGLVFTEYINRDKTKAKTKKE